MLLVVDVNVLFSFFKKYSGTRKLLTNPKLKLYTSEYASEELQEHLGELISKAKIDINIFELYKTVLSWFVEFIPVSEYKLFKDEASTISPDQDDTQYFALALKLDCPIWSNDKRLKQQSKVKIFNTKELIELLKEGKLE